MTLEATRPEEPKMKFITLNRKGSTLLKKVVFTKYKEPVKPQHQESKPTEEYTD
jgi:hypothetical protein